MPIPNAEQARLNMIVQQIKPWNVNDDNVLNVMQAIPRENFVPEAYAGLAYADVEIPLGSEQSMLFPRVEARLLQALDIKPTDRILEVGTGTGYLTACLAKLGNFVTSYDSQAAFTDIARDNLESLGLGNIRLETGNVFAADIPAGSFDAIAVTGSMPQHNEYLEQLLAPHGRMFAIVGSDPAMEATIFTRIDAEHIAHTGLFETSVPMLNGLAIPEQFSF